MTFKDKVPNTDKLIKYGFKKAGSQYIFKKEIFDGQFTLTVKTDANGNISTEVYDKTVEDIYTLHLVADAAGKFVGRIRTEYEETLKDIEVNCFDILHNEYTAEILKFAKSEFGDEPEYLWEKYPNYAVLRKQSTKKWYAALMTIPKNKLGLNGNEMTEIIDLRFDETELPLKIDGKSFFAGYHMNKKHWITIILDGSVPIDDIFEYIRKSYNMA